jgi:toxin ParE1/3/4
MSSPSNYTLIFSPEAIEDLKDIVAYSVATWGTEQAGKYNQKLKGGLASIRQNLRQGRSHPQLSRQYLVYHVGRHFIVYTVKATNIEIVRVLHDRMDLPHHLN